MRTSQARGKAVLLAILVNYLVGGKPGLGSNSHLRTGGVVISETATVITSDPLQHRLLPAADPTSDFFWTGGADGRLRFQTCADCGYRNHPPSPVCARCLSRDLTPQPVSGRGTVLTFTVNFQQWTPGQEPYVIAIVGLAEQDDLRLTTNIIDCAPEDVTVGADVQVVFLERRGVYYPLFRLAEKP